jgi:hypothetical protein
MRSAVLAAQGGNKPVLLLLLLQVLLQLVLLGTVAASRDAPDVGENQALFGDPAYKTLDYQDPVVVQAELLELDLDGDGRLDNNVVLFPPREDEQSVLTLVAGFTDPFVLSINPAVTASTAVFEKLFPRHGDEVSMVFLKKGTALADVRELYTPFDRIAEELESFEQEKQATRNWLRGALRTDLTVVNYLEEAVELLWLEPTAIGNRFEEHHAADVPPWEMEQRDTLIGHQFAVRFANGTELRRFMVKSDDVVVLGAVPPTLGQREPDFEEELEAFRAQQTEIASEAPRLTEACFRVQPVPPAVLADAQRFIALNGKNALTEPDFMDKIATNWWEAALGFLPLGQGKHGSWGRALHDDARRFAGLDEIAPSMGVDTALRIYHKGAKQLQRVFPMPKLISVLIPVARDGTEPWPVRVQVPDGETHEVDLKVGDMMFVESARCLHGRPEPLKGGEFAEVAFHFEHDPADGEERDEGDAEHDAEGGEHDAEQDAENDPEHDAEHDAELDAEHAQGEEIETLFSWDGSKGEKEEL